MNMTTDRARIISAVAAALSITVGVSSAADAATTEANLRNERTESAPIVVGSGPNAVYIGRAPTLGGDPARGETEDSYFARTGRHLPGRSSAAVVDGTWWYGRAPVTGGDPALGESDTSYFARTGRHLPAR
jgi:hypothetical protein